MQEILERYINYLEVERNVSPYTVRNYTSDLLGNYARGSGKGFFQFLKNKQIDSLEQVDKHTLREYIAWLMAQGVVKPSIARKLSAIRSFYRYLLREELITSSPIPLSRKGGRISSFSIKLDKRLPLFLTKEEMERLLKAPDLSKPVGKRNRALLELLYASGLRVSELVTLNLGQIDLDAREIRVWGKGAKERIALMGKPAAKALSVYLGHNGRDKLLRKDEGKDKDKKEQALFLNYSGGRLTRRMVQKILDNYAAKVGIEKNVHPHTLRHTFATHLLDGGADLRVVQELLGHDHLYSTQIYTHVAKSQARKVYLSAHPMAKREDDEPENK